MDESFVELVRVGKSFGTQHALRDIEFSVPAGQICGLVGPNGAGKTTLFRLLMGILRASDGSIRIAGRDAFEERVELKRVVGFLPDEPVFYAYLSGREILLLSAGLHDLDPTLTVERLAPLIEQLELTNELDRYAEDYSRGMKKKLGLLLALLHQPQLLILDEPTNGLDVASTRAFSELMRAEAERGTTILFSTHLMDQVTSLCTHVVLLSHGQLVARGAISELLAQYGQLSFEEFFLQHTASKSLQP